MNEIIFNYYTFYQNNLYFFEGRKAFLGKINIETGEVSYIQDIDNYCIKGGEDMDFTICKNDKIYALKTDGTILLIYNVKKNSCEYIELKCNRSLWGNFAYMCEYKNKIFIFPKDLKKVFCVTDNDKLVEIELNNISITKVECAQSFGKNVYLFSQNSRLVYVYNLETNELESYKLSIEIKDIISCAADMKNIYLLSAYGNVFMYDIAEKQVHKIRILDNMHTDSETRARIVVVLDNIFVFPWNAKDIEVISLKDKKVEIFMNYPSDFCYYKDANIGKFDTCCENDKYYFLLKYSNYMLKIEKRTGEFIWTKIVKNNEDSELRRALQYGHKFFFECSYSTKEFINEIISLPKLEEMEYVENGRKIWDSLNGKL